METRNAIRHGTKCRSSWTYECKRSNAACNRLVFAVATEYGRPIETSSVSQYSPTIIYCIRRGLEKRTQNSSSACLIMPRHGTSVLMVVGIYNLKCTTDRVIVFPSCAGKMILNMLPHNSCKAPWVAVLIACAREAITEWVPSMARCSFILFHSSTRAAIPQSLLYGHFGLFGFWCIIKFQEVNRKACNWSDFHDFTQSCHYVRHCPTMSMWWHAYGSATSRPFPSNCRWCCQPDQCGCALFLTLTRKFAAFIPAIEGHISLSFSIGLKRWNLAKMRMKAEGVSTYVYRCL